ncbi:MAG: hypothetical protein B5M56_02530 [Desulfococcus sp. 4484_241]|nr:MAG: hypothetical protein B5M56_02530 [Desulfococcus sp. 4484_241]
MDSVKKICAVLMLTFAAFAFAACRADASPAAKSGTPSAVVEEKVYKFSTVPEGTDVTHDFVIKNTGTAVLKINRVHPG